MKSTLYTNDNLFILTGMNSESVDLIYLDPPFNSKRMYSAPIGSKSAGASFKDMWTWADVNEYYLEKMIEKYPTLVSFIQSIQTIHSKAMMAYITYMTQRLIEMHRVLKDTGSLYLHCDPTASHYLKIVLDEVFGRKNFRTEITWKRQTAKKGSQFEKRTFGNSSDTIFWYSKSENYNFKIPKTEVSEDELIKKFDRIDENEKRYRTDRITLPKGMSRENLKYEYKGFTPAYGWMMNKKKLKQFDKENRIYWTKEGTPYRKYFLDEYEGREVSNVWTDIYIASGHERTGYPTQKPLALLQRIIKASSNEGDVVFDPFCGCATTCVAAQQLGRKWIGIDIEKKASDVLIDRLSDDAGMFKDFIHRNDVPQRSDIRIEPATKTIKEKLFQTQANLCNGCSREFEIFDLEIDHIVPTAKGGGDYVENYQLLCGNCNRIKGDRPMEYLNMKIKKREEVLKIKLTFGE